MKYPLITLHSGAGGTLPNSRAYLEYAARTAHDIVEVDIRCTGDGQAVLHHDPFFRHEGAEYNIADWPLKELQKVKPGLLCLKEALDYGRGNNFFWNLDMKDSSCADVLLFELDRSGCEHNAIISGCGLNDVSHLRNKKPVLRVLFNLPDQELDCAGDEEYEETVRKLVHDGAEAGCCGLNVNYLYCRPFLVHYASLRALPVMVWTIDTAEDLERFSSMGVFSLTLGKPDLINRLRISA